MPALPWVEQQAVEPEHEYVVMASRLPLKAYRHVPGFLRDTMRVRRQLKVTAGLVGYALDAQLVHKTFWTFSVWTDRASLEAFAAADPHATIIRRLQPRMNDTRFDFSRMRGAALPETWSAHRGSPLTQPGLAGSLDHPSRRRSGAHPSRCAGSCG